MASIDQRDPVSKKFEDFVSEARQIGAVGFRVEPKSGSFLGSGETQPFRGEVGHYDVFVAYRAFGQGLRHVDHREKIFELTGTKSDLVYIDLSDRSPSGIRPTDYAITAWATAESRGQELNQVFPGASVRPIISGKMKAEIEILGRQPIPRQRA